MTHAPAVEFLKRRYTSAIERADDRTATRLRAEIDRLINPSARALPGRAAGATSARRAGANLVEFALAYDDILGPHL